MLLHPHNPGMAGRIFLKRNQLMRLVLQKSYKVLQEIFLKVIWRGSIPLQHPVDLQQVRIALIQVKWTREIFLECGHDQIFPVSSPMNHALRDRSVP